MAIDLDAPFARVNMLDAIKDKTGVDFWPEMSVDDARKLADEHDVHL